MTQGLTISSVKSPIMIFFHSAIYFHGKNEVTCSEQHEGEKMMAEFHFWVIIAFKRNESLP